MSKWKGYLLKEIGEIITGSTPSTMNEKYWNGGIPFYSPADFIGHAYCDFTEKTITEEAFSISRAITEKSIMVTCIGSTIGKIAISKKRGITNQQINSIIPNNKHDFLFVYFLLNYYAKSFTNYASQTAIPIINKNDFAQFSFRFPSSVSEQRKIASILSSVDALSEKTEAAITKYKAIKRGMMQDLFTRGLDKNGKLRPRYQDVPELYKQTELGWIPQEWDLINLSCVSENILSNVDKNTIYNEQSVSLCNYLDVYTNLYIRNNMDFMQATAKPVEISRFQLDVDDVIITKDSEDPDDIAVAAVVSSIKPNLLCGYHLCILRTNKKKLMGSYLMHQLHFETINNQFTIRANGSTRYGLPKTAIDDALVIVPHNMTEQNMVSKILVSIDSQLDAEYQMRNKQMNFKLALMSILLTGRVPVKYEEEKSKEAENATVN